MNASPSEATATALDETIIDVSDGALAKVLEVRSEENDSEGLALRISVNGVSGVEYTYDLAFVPVEDADDGDHSYCISGLTVLVPSESRYRLAGATLDLPSNAGQGGLVIRQSGRAHG